MDTHPSFADSSDVTSNVAHTDRFAAFAIAMVSGATALVSLCVLWLYYGFSTMVDPGLPAADRTHAILNRFLFHEGFSQFLFIGGLICAASISTFSITIHSAILVFGVPSRKKALLISVIGGSITSVILIATLYAFALS